MQHRWKGRLLPPHSELVVLQQHLQQLRMEQLQHLKHQRHQKLAQKQQELTYGGPDPITGAVLPYSMCLEGQMEQICFVYRQQDVSRTLNYLRDGIFDVFISKSYRAVKEAAAASYCLFALDIQSPLFILAEDKAAIPGYVVPPGYRMPKRLDRRQRQSAAAGAVAAATGVAIAPTVANAATDPSQMEVEVSHLGRFIVFDLGNLKVHNAYVPAIVSHPSHEQPREQQHEQHEQQQHEQQQDEHFASSLLRPPSFGASGFLSVVGEGEGMNAATDSGELKTADEGPQGEVICSDLRLEMRGMQISASDNTQEPAVGGCLLENVEARMLLRSAPTSLSIEAETTAWLLHLSRQQLTLVLDVINENIGGQGYTPATAGTAADSSAGASVGGCVDESALRRELETPPLAVECHIVIPQLTLEASYGAEAPLALLSLHRITAKVAVSVSRLLSCYRFLLCAEEFSIDDLRSNSANYFKRVAHCTAPADSRCCGEVGEELPPDSHGEEESDSSEGADSLHRRSSRAPGVQFEFGSSLRESYMDFQFSGVTVYLLLVAFMDILSYFTSSWAFSSMRSYPKPLPTLLKNAEKQQQQQQQQAQQQQGGGEKRACDAPSSESKSPDSARGDAMALLLSGEALRERPFRVSVSIRRGCFVVYSALQSPAAPIIVWSSDFLVDLSMKGDEISFERVKVLGSKICRLNAAPLPIRPQPHRAVYTAQDSNTSSCSTDNTSAASFDAAAEQHRRAKEGSAGARTVRWGSTDSSSSSGRNDNSSSRYGCSFEFSDSPRGVRQQSAETAMYSDWKQQQETHRPQQMMRDWTHMQQLQQLQQLVSGGGPSPERLAPHTDPASAVLLCEQFHLEGRGTYRSTPLVPNDGGESTEQQQGQKQQQGQHQQQHEQTQGNNQGAAATTPQSGHARVPAAVHRMQQAFSAAAAKLPPSSISPPGGRRAPPLSSGSTSATPKQQEEQKQRQQQRQNVAESDEALPPAQQQQQELRKQQQQGKHPSDPEDPLLAGLLLLLPNSRRSRNSGSSSDRTRPRPMRDFHLHSSSSKSCGSSSNKESILQIRRIPCSTYQANGKKWDQRPSFVCLPSSTFFFLRVSSRDMALLLAAAQGLHSDGPSVCPPQQPPPIRFPETCAQQQQQQQQQEQQEDVDKRVSQQLPPLVERTAKISLCLEGAQLLLLDDLRSSVMPVLQLRLAAGGLVFDITAAQLQVALRDFSCGLDYLNAKAGCWEPFIEKLDVTAVYRRDYAEEKQQLLQRQQAQVGALELPPGEDPWGSFKAARTLMLHSQSPFWLNCTPQLCELFAWFLPYLLAHLTEGGVPSLDQKGSREGPNRRCLSPATVSRSSSAAASGLSPPVLQVEGDAAQDDTGSREGPNRRCLSPATVSRSSSAAAAGLSPPVLQVEGDAAQDDTVELHKDICARLARSCSEGEAASAAAAAAAAAVAATAAAVASKGREAEAAFRYLNLTGECLYAFTMHKLGRGIRGSSKDHQSNSAAAAAAAAAVAATAAAVASKGREAEAAFRYLNLTGECLYAFTMHKLGRGIRGSSKDHQSNSSSSSSSRSGLRSGGDDPDVQTVDSLLLLVPGSSSPLPLDGLLQRRTAEASRRSRSRQRFYITNCPPVESVLQLKKMFPSVSVPSICRSIMSTQDVQHTLSFLTTNEEMRRKIRVRNMASLALGHHQATVSTSPSSPTAQSAAAMLIGPAADKQQQQQDKGLEGSQSPKTAGATGAPAVAAAASPRRLSEGGIDPSPPAIGPFARGTKAVAVDSMRNCCVALLPPVRHSVSSRICNAAAAAAALRGPAGSGNLATTTAERFLGGSTKGTSSSSSSSSNKFAVRQLQRLRSSLTLDRKPSGIPLDHTLSDTSSLASAISTAAGTQDKQELPKQEQHAQQQQQKRQQQDIDNPLNSVPQETGRNPTGLETAPGSGAPQKSYRTPAKAEFLSVPRPGSGSPAFVDAEPRQMRGAGAEAHQQRSGEPSTISSSFSAPLPLAHVDTSSEAICQVLSPHPSYKLLLLSTTVLVHNSSGMPLEICFLDADLNPLLLPAAHGAYAPLEAIGEAPPSACKKGQLSMDEPSSLHPDLSRIPEWMVQREERWKEVQRRQTLQQREQLMLLLQASATKSPTLNRTASAPLRRALTESGRFAAYTRSPTYHRSLQRQESAEEAFLNSPPQGTQPNERLTYTFLLPNQHVLSVPQRAILGTGWCNVCFRPAAFAEEAPTTTAAPSAAAVNREASPSERSDSDTEAEVIPAPPDMSCIAGWCDMIDTRHRMEGLRCRQSSYLPPDCRPGASAGAAQHKTAGSPSMGTSPAASGDGGGAAAGTGGGCVKTVRNLYFLVHIEGRKGALPAEKELKRVTIFPSLTLVNATTTELDVYVAPSSASLKTSRRQLSVAPATTRTAEAALQELHALQQRPLLSATLRRRSTFLVYDVPPNRPLRFRMRFAMLEGAEWSSIISDLLSTQHIEGYLVGLEPVSCGELQDEVVSRVLLPSRHHASVELEVLHDTAEVIPFLPHISPRQLVAVIAAPRAFIDRTGLGVRPVQDGRFFPEFDGAICRVVSLVPEFILTNALKIPLFFRQYGTPGPAFEVQPGQSYPVYWASSDLPQAIQFRPGAGDGYAWSGAVVASEETAGKSWIALYNGIRDAAPGVFCVEVAPDGGVKSICIRGAEGNSEGFLVINRCPVIQRVMVHTYHTEMSMQGQSTDIGGGSSSFSPSSSTWSRQPMKLPDFDFHFFAYEGETVAYGWPFPFTYTSRPCQVLLWIDSKTVAPKSPIALDLETPQYKRYEVNLGLPNMPQIIVRTEKRGDAMIIEVRPKPGTGPERPLAVLPSPKSQGTEPDTAVESPLRSLHVAVTMAQVGVSLIYDAVREELCFAEMSQLAIGFQERGERQKLLVRIADIQIDNQMEHARKPVLLANRGGGGSGTEESFSAQGASKPFLSLFVVRHHTTSSDIILRRVQLEVDNLEVEIDADALNGLNDFLWACMTSLGLMSAASRRTVSAEELGVWIESPIHQTYTRPPLPTVLSLESMLIDRFDVYCWCSFVLDKMHMLSDLLKVGLRILMASGRLELMGAKLNFQREEFRNLRGTAKTFMASLQERYTYHLLNSVFSSLGQSSLLNLPRMPFELGKNTIGLAANAVDSVSAGLGSLLSTFTFDSEYINRRQRERVRSASSMRDGFLSAGKNIGEGVWSLTNIVTKPIEGAQREGVGGFFKGIGKGIVGSLVKPLDKVGQAVSDVTRGIKAEVSKPIGASKFRNERRRKPRMLGELGEIRPYDETEATLRECLGLAVTRRLQKFITVLKEEVLPPRHLVVLFYPKDIFFVDLAGAPQACGGSQVGDESESGGAKNVNVLWHASIPLVRDIRASTHGVVIRAGQPSVQQPKDVLVALSSLDSSPRAQRSHVGALRHVEARGDRCYQIPCPSAALISQLYKELLEAVHGSTSVVQLGTWDAQRYAETDNDS
ncbi:Vacuolar protein sorting-associated protein 13 family protein, related [Eimeria praecox]|uniref:Vacuolar protein sorting-associated protein 13 family protein, related n=1 Tax=Eimeria praecox TaxID=51316 RepID=U6G0S4_9EIME|nr:Vacuolar protein sorting-associated protein 13 family protein, related [Eimeria praecox]